MTDAFMMWVATHAASEDYGAIHQDDPEDQAAFWISKFVDEINDRENDCCDFDNDDIEDGLKFNDVVTEFFDD